MVTPSCHLHLINSHGRQWMNLNLIPKLQVILVKLITKFTANVFITIILLLVFHSFVVCSEPCDTIYFQNPHYVMQSTHTFLIRPFQDFLFFFFFSFLFGQRQLHPKWKENVDLTTGYQSSYSPIHKQIASPLYIAKKSSSIVRNEGMS